TQRVRGDDSVYLDSVEFDSVEGGGTVTLAANLASGRLLKLILAPDEPTQPSRFRGLSSFTLKLIEMALDRLGGAIQRLAYIGARSLKIHDLDDVSAFTTMLPPGIAENGDRVVVVNPAGTGFTFGPTTAEIDGAE